jgi:hypothetical protein
MSTKVCNRCERAKPLDQFRKCHLAKDGKMGYCNACKRPRKARAAAESALEQGLGPKMICSPALGFSAQIQNDDLVVLMMPRGSQELHTIADRVGSKAIIVFADPAEYTDGMHVLQAQADQGALPLEPEA